MKVIKNNRYIQSISICIFLFIILFVCYKLEKVSSDTAVAIGVAIIGLIGITFQILDDLFGRRFFAVVNNKEVQKDLIKNWEYYKNIYYLYKEWSNYKIKHKQKYPLMYKNCLLTKLNNFYQKNKENLNLKQFIEKLSKESLLLKNNIKKEV